MNKFLLLTMTLMILMSTLSIAGESDTVWSKEIGSSVRTVIFSPDGEFIYAAANGRKPMKLSTETGKIIKEYEGFVFEAEVFFLAMDISSDGKWLICGAYGNDMYIFETETGEKVKTLKTEYEDIQSNKFNSVTITPDKRYIIAANLFDGQEQGTKYGIVIWDAQSGELIKVINSKDAMIVKASPDNLHCAVSYYDEGSTDIKIYDIGTWETNTSLCCNNNLVQDISYSTDGSLIASGSKHGSVKIWNVNEKQLIKEFPGGDEVYSVNFIGNDKVIAGCGNFWNRYVKIWEIQSENFLGEIRTDAQPDLAISETKHLCVVANASSGIFLFDYLNIITSIIENTQGSTDKSNPNPTDNISEINFFLPVSGNTLISISDANARIIDVLHNGFLEQGEHKFQWTPKGISSGTYFCNITGQNFTKTLKIILEK